MAPQQSGVLGVQEEGESTPCMGSQEPVNPLKVRLCLGPADYARTVFLGLTLLPIRLVGILSTFLLSWLLSFLALEGADESLPLAGWRGKVRDTVAWLGRACLFCCGFHSVKILGQQCSKEEAPVLVVAPHSSFFDAIMVFCSGFPYMVNREENRNIPLMGRCIRLNQTIFVSREGADSRSRAVTQIRDRVLSPLAWPHLVIWPEGFCSNRKALMQFKPGAFIPGVAVQPVLIRYGVRAGQDTISWTWDQPHGAVTCLLLTLTQWSSSAALEFLPVYTPSTEEKEDPQLYADNVRSLMASRLAVPLCPLSFTQAKLQFPQRNKKYQ